MSNENKNKAEITNAVNKIKRLASDGKRKKDTNQKIDVLFDLEVAKAELQSKIYG